MRNVTTREKKAAIIGALQLLKRTPELPSAVPVGETRPAFTGAEIDRLVRKLQTRGMPRVVIVVDGGLVHEVIADSPISATVVDFDVECADEDEITKVPEETANGSRPSEKDASISSPFLRVSGRRITAMLKNRPRLT